MEGKKKIAIACQGGGSHTAFSAGVLKKLLEKDIHEQYDIVGLSGTSGGGICATTTWYGLLKKAKGSQELVYKWLVDFWKDNSANLLWEKYLNNWTIQTIRLQDKGMIPTIAANPYTSEWLLNLWKSLSPRKEYLNFKTRVSSEGLNYPYLEQGDAPSSSHPLEPEKVTLRDPKTL